MLSRTPLSNTEEKQRGAYAIGQPICSSESDAGPQRLLTHSTVGGGQRRSDEAKGKQSRCAAVCGSITAQEAFSTGVNAAPGADKPTEAFRRPSTRSLFVFAFLIGHPLTRIRPKRERRERRDGRLPKSKYAVLAAPVACALTLARLGSMAKPSCGRETAAFRSAPCLRQPCTNMDPWLARPIRASPDEPGPAWASPQQAGANQSHLGWAGHRGGGWRVRGGPMDQE